MRKCCYNAVPDLREAQAFLDANGDAGEEVSAEPSDESSEEKEQAADGLVADEIVIGQ